MGGFPGGQGSGDYTLDTLPGSGVFQGNGTGAGGQSRGAMTAAERAAVLDEQLRRTYETYDQVLAREQADARGAASGAGSSGPGGGAQAGGGQGAMQQDGSGPGGGLPNDPSGSASAEGASVSSEQETFPPPDDIPSGRDDDLVARQLREAAMVEADPELREALWDEYRNYTGIRVNR